MSSNLQQTKTHTITISVQDQIHEWANQFYQAKKVEGISPYTLTFYKQQLSHFIHYCDCKSITQFGEITPMVIREFLLEHEQAGHNAGGLHAAFRVLRTFLLWFENEVEPEDWKNPINKIKAPKVAQELLDPADVKDISAMIRGCRNGFLDARDKAYLLFLLDTGARARESLQVNLADVNPITGAITIRSGKGRKPRTVFLGRTSRKALRAYLKLRNDNCPALWITAYGERLAYSGLRAIINRRAKQAGVKVPTIHSFRRAFALNMLRAGVDIYSLQTLMGHADLQVLRRYLKQVDGDLQYAHAKGGPVDNLL